MGNRESIDLNIKDRGLEGQEWTSERGKITARDLDSVNEQKTNNGGALNALPTPFARFFLFKEAFRRILEQKKNPANEAGQAYTRLVSDCLDVFELLFNLNYHKNHWAGREIIIKEWDAREDMLRIKNTMPVLYNSVSTYYPKDINLDKLYFIVLKENGKEKLLATSSPISGFITPPDLDRKDIKADGNTIIHEYLGERYKGLKLQRKPKDDQRSRGNYFGEVELFEKRPADFKNYMFKMFNAEVDNQMKEIKNYIKSFADTDTDIRLDFIADWEPVESENNDKLEYCGITICASKALDVNKFFADSIIKLPYRISADNFYSPEVEGKDDRTYDYLLPLTDDALSIIDTENFTCKLKEKALGSKVEIKLIHSGKEYTKVYDSSSSNTEGIGKIVDFAHPYNVNMEIGLFPNVKSKNAEDNNYYKLMIAIADHNSHKQFNINEVDCTFFAKEIDKPGNSVIELADSDTYNSGVRVPVVRTEQNDENKCGTKFYEVFNSEISAIALHLNIEGKTHTGVIIPKFHQNQHAIKEYTYAIDFGTSNTYISKRQKGSNYEPEQLKMNSTMMSYLHEVKNSKQKNLIDLWEDIPFEDSADYFQTEFVPPFIDGQRYKFPLRTAMVKTKRALQEPSLFDNHNIAFSYEKKKLVGDHEVVTDIKWDESTTEARLFIRELLMIVKNDVLLSDGILSQTEIIWFYPLSLTPKLKEKFDQIWKQETELILGKSVQVRCYTESEAPYYYYAEKDVFESIDSVAVVDIGGGSTDMVYFIDGKPQLANSVHFGCDILWGNGYNKMSNARDNGIYQRYVDKISFGTDENLHELNSDMTKPGSYASTRDIINFWISNSDKTKLGDDNFTSLLRQEGKPLFLYHYASIIYYMARLFKTQNLECPNAITFSGNGSRYIDNFISSDIETLTNLTMIILSDVFGDDTKRVQLILRECRKESTCYGGLYREQSLPSPKAVIFNGVDNKEYEMVADITKDFQDGSLRDNLINEIDHLGELYMEMLRKLVRNDELDNIKTAAIEEEIKKGNASALDKNFKEEIRDRLDPNIKFKDSLFFIPVVDKVKDLTMIDNYIK